MSYLTPSADRLSRVVRALMLVLCVAATAFVAPSIPLLHAQQEQPQRVVQGRVVDGSGAGLKAATVYLKDDHSLAVKSYIASDDGSYRFGQLAKNTDYQLWAEVGGKKSAVKNISSFDNRAEFNINLKIEAAK
jgi:hypothetical protein